MCQYLRFLSSIFNCFIDIKSFRSHYGSGVDSASNRNEYQEYFLGGKGGRCVRLTTLPPSCTVVMKPGNLNFLEPSGPLQACNGTSAFTWVFQTDVCTKTSLRFFSNKTLCTINCVISEQTHTLTVTFSCDKIGKEKWGASHRLQFSIQTLRLTWKEHAVMSNKLPAVLYQNACKHVYCWLWCFKVSDVVVTSNNDNRLYAFFFFTLVTEDKMNTVTDY